MQIFIAIKDAVVKYYEFIKEIDDMVLSRLRGEDEFDRPKKEYKRVNRQNNVRVEDLRPQKNEEAG